MPFELLSLSVCKSFSPQLFDCIIPTRSQKLRLKFLTGPFFGPAAGGPVLYTLLSPLSSVSSWREWDELMSAVTLMLFLCYVFCLFKTRVCLLFGESTFPTLQCIYPPFDIHLDCLNMTLKYVLLDRIFMCSVIS